MTSEEFKDLIEKHSALMKAGDHAGAAEIKQELFTNGVDLDAQDVVVADEPVEDQDVTTVDILDGTIKTIKTNLEELDLETLEALMAAEQAGKTRKGVVKAISEAIEALAGN